MTSTEYQWRHLTDAQRQELVAWRRSEGRPWHSPPHPPNFGNVTYLVTAACYEHASHVGRSRGRMDEFVRALLATLNANCDRVFAWCLLPNHYHALVDVPDVKFLIAELGRLHGRTSHAWNGEEGARGRKVFYRASDRAMRSEAHAFATLNYVHHNAVHHGFVERWQDWRWSSATEYLERTGEAEARRVWHRYPMLDFGKGWDEPSM